MPLHTLKTSLDSGNNKARQFASTTSSMKTQSKVCFPSPKINGGSPASRRSSHRIKTSLPSPFFLSQIPQMKDCAPGGERLAQIFNLTSWKNRPKQPHRDSQRGRPRDESRPPVTTTFFAESFMNAGPRCIRRFIESRNALAHPREHLCFLSFDWKQHPLILKGSLERFSE